MCKIAVSNYNGHIAKPIMKAQRNAGIYSQNLVSKSESKNCEYSFFVNKSIR